MKKWLKGILAVLLLIVLIVVGYVAYVFFTYDRIPDNVALTPEAGGTRSAVTPGVRYSILTQNIGFGAYTDDFTFFMDGGKESRARSPESVEDCLNQAAATLGAYASDFILFQEVDTDSTRSFHMDQYAMLKDAFPGYSTTFAENFHSAYLFWPLLEPHGASKAGVTTFSRADITSGLRRSIPISESFSKLFDLDRCYSISRVPVSNGKELVLFNVHLSAYGAGANIKEQQLVKLFGDMSAEYEKGNYVICGGDFNADWTGDSRKILYPYDYPEAGWTMPFPDSLIPAGITKCVSYSSGKIQPTARDCDRPYKPGNFTLIVDGFFVSENVTVDYLENVQTGFTYSDHCPVYMRFTLND
ncbi:MAG: endonuclease/exonuclease/phosphatase family protein [Treponemataceae bacterium]|nr:endonuclease/exonuclease/phosphatase family protein [Treponemataceae bacterium]